MLYDNVHDKSVLYFSRLKEFRVYNVKEVTISKSMEKNLEPYFLDTKIGQFKFLKGWTYTLEHAIYESMCR